MKRDKSILQPKMDECYICRKINGIHTTYGLHTHEIFFGVNRQNSIKWGCYVKLCGYHHNGSNDGVHYNIAQDLDLKRDGQIAFEKLYGHDKFMEVFGKNYL